jgi:CRISPR-associated protein Cas1
MANVYLTEQGAVLHKVRGRLVVEKNGAVLLEVLTRKLDAVLVFGNVQVTTQALAEMLDQGIALALFSRSGKLRGQLTPPKARNIPLRMRQYELAHTEGPCLELAREVVRCKITNSAAVLRRFRRNHPEAIAPEAIDALDQSAAAAAGAPSPETLRGIEGAAAARYFDLFGALLPGDIGFAGRSRRPPRDPVNALLSFGYVLVGNELQSLLDGMGIDPYLGFFHGIDYGRPSLALDLLEEFRAALVDRWTATLLNLKVLGSGDFSATPEGGVLLGRAGMQRYLPAYEKELTTPFACGGADNLSFRQLFRRQAERLARSLTEGEPYRGFLLPC